MAHSIPGNASPTDLPIWNEDNYGRDSISQIVRQGQSAASRSRPRSHRTGLRTAIAEDKAIRSRGHFMVPVPALTPLNCLKATRRTKLRKSRNLKMRVA